MYDTYIIDDRQADRKHLRNLLVQYQIQNGVEARITGCTFADQLTPQTVTVMYFARRCRWPCAVGHRAGARRADAAPYRFDRTKLPAAHSGCDRRNAADRAAFKAGRRGGTVPAAARSGAAVRLLQTQATYVWTVKAGAIPSRRTRFYILKAAAKKTFLVTAAQEYELSASLDALEEQLGSRFVRTHRSYLVNQRHILSYDAGTMTVTLDDESVVYLSRAGKAKLKEALAW